MGATGSIDQRNPKEPTNRATVGDRFWVWFADEPSAFEVHLADTLTAFPKSEPSQDDNGVFHVRAYSWRGRPDFTQEFVQAYLPRSVELPDDGMIKFVTIDDKLEFSIPVETLSFSYSAEAGAIHVTARKIILSDQTLMILASRQSDHDREAPALTGSFDALGLISLLSGNVLLGRCLFSSYFCTTRKKFLSGALGVVGPSPVDWAPIKFADDNPDTRFDARNNRTHAALWFAGSAFSANDNASKVVSYVTALEILTGKNIKNYLSRLYRKDSELHKAALEKVLALMDLRGDLVHKGQRIVLSPELERYAQAFILDAIRDNNKVASARFAVQSVIEATRR
ncbi:HEPN domain-containing protein [Bradyrhizobium sp. CB2312]|uniref:HEPN domain-containing protein n=1 Tax=Bradyrhizobium sp. CB2312 TaxID=3039155 RepID=UPI0024B192B1|nr:HEPN domain-containing protein [Bradyrhizobium sp. CB2312]WFU73703.1 HEPN domain-containing protein [Bradyrhizobium sp. CB2312]